MQTKLLGEQHFLSTIFQRSPKNIIDPEMHFLDQLIPGNYANKK